MTRDHTKVLIPCYKDIDAYDLPKEFQKLQAQDLGKVGATQDLLRGIDKICGRATEQIKQDGTNNYQPIIQEGMLYEIRRHFNGPDLIEKVLSYGTKIPMNFGQNRERLHKSKSIFIQESSSMLFYGARSLKQRPFNSICISMIKTAMPFSKPKILLP